MLAFVGPSAGTPIYVDCLLLSVVSYLALVPSVIAAHLGGFSFWYGVDAIRIANRPRIDSLFLKSSALQFDQIVKPVIEDRIMCLDECVLPILKCFWRELIRMKLEHENRLPLSGGIILAPG